MQLPTISVYGTNYTKKALNNIKILQIPWPIMNDKIDSNPNQRFHQSIKQKT